MAADGQHEVAIIGAGIAGLTAAWELRDRDVVVLEATERVGGRMMSEPRGPYWLNMGAHLFGEPGSLMARLVEEMGLETRAIPGNRMGLYLNGRLVASGRPESYPLRLPLSLGARLSFVRAGLKLWWATRGFFRVARPRPGEAPRLRRARVLSYRSDRTFAEYLGKLHPDVDLIFRAISERITGSPETISAGCGAAIFGAVWDTKKALARNLIGGSALLPQALARNLGERVVTGATVSEVVAGADGCRLRFAVAGRDQEISARYVIAATPAYVTRQILRDLPEDTARALEGVPYGPFVCVAILTGETGPMPWDGIYAIAAGGKSFNMLFNHANVLREPGKREPGGSLMAYGGGESGRRLLAMTDEEIREVVLRDVCEIFPEVRDVVREVIVQRWEKALPYVDRERHRLQPALEKPLGNVFLAGDYLEFAEMESAAATGHEAAVEVRARLTAS